MRKSFFIKSLIFAIVFWHVFIPAASFAGENSKTVAKASSVVVELEDFCSGFIVDKKKQLVATANHCANALKRQKKIVTEYPDGHKKVTFETYYIPVILHQRIVNTKGDVVKAIDVFAEVVLTDEKHDVALLKVSQKNSAFFKYTSVLDTSDVSYGDEVFHYGMPLGIWGTFSKGYISKPKLGFVSHIPGFIPLDAIIHTAYINHGSSGGPLFNSEGYIIGMTNWGQAGGPYIATRAIHIKNLMSRVISE